MHDFFLGLLRLKLTVSQSLPRDVSYGNTFPEFFLQITPPYIIVLGVTIPLQLFVKARIWRFKRRPSVHPISNQSTGAAAPSQQHLLAALRDNSGYFAMAALTAAALSPLVAMAALGEGSAGGPVGSWALVFFPTYLTGPCLTVAYSAVVYSKDGAMRRYVWRELVRDGLLRAMQ